MFTRNCRTVPQSNNSIPLPKPDTETHRGKGVSFGWNQRTRCPIPIVFTSENLNWTEERIDQSTINLIGWQAHINDELHDIYYQHSFSWRNYVFCKTDGSYTSDLFYYSLNYLAGNQFYNSKVTCMYLFMKRRPWKRQK